MYFHKNVFILVFSMIFFSANGQIKVNAETTLFLNHPDSLLVQPKNHLKVAGLILASNLSVWTYDRFIKGGSYARINLSTIKLNLKTGFVGDNDGFLTNLISHPYHGGIYFNAGRCNGLNFWQSAPYSAAGSLMWEFFLENEPASINDFISSTFGGILLGEISYRISDRLIDNRSVGFDRFKREALLTLISPVRGLSRILSGEAWRHRTSRGNSVRTTPFSFYTSIGYQILTDRSLKINKNSLMVGYDLGILYGNPFDQENEKPFDFFSFNASGNFFSRQPELSLVNSIGMLYCSGFQLQNSTSQLAWGIFQHFNYYQINGDISNEARNQFKISEAASVGLGLLYKNKFSKYFIFTGSAYLNAILLGGYHNDYFQPKIRNYNMGSGFSPKLNLELQMNDKARFSVNFENFQLYSWIGNLPGIEEITGSKILGDKGKANLNVLMLALYYKINSHIFVSLKDSYYYSRNIYTNLEDVKHSITGNKLSLGYIF